MQYVVIKQDEKDGITLYTVNAIPLKNKSKAVIQKIPHPLGSDILEFKTLEEAKEAITLAGFSYILPGGKKGSPEPVKPQVVRADLGYEQIVLNAIKDKINSSNLNVAASAVLALSEFPCEETFDILFEKLGEDNDAIRKNAISGVCRYQNVLQNRIIESLKSSNWVVRNSALNCISNISENSDINVEKFIVPLTQVCEDSNTIVQALALTTLAKVYQVYQKNRKV